jgi:hypothetical protein
LENRTIANKLKLPAFIALPSEKCIFRSGQQVSGDDRKIFVSMTSIYVQRSCLSSFIASS